MQKPLHRTVQDTLARSMDAREARAVAMLLMERVAGLTPAGVLAGRDEALGADVARRVAAMARRVAQGEPVQYVLGAADFCGLSVGVAPGVLVPRPETEELVAWVAEDGARAPRPAGALRFLDIGTGSGCIALALKSRFPGAEVAAWDVSPAALRIARANAARLGLDVGFELRDVLAPVAPAGGGFSAVVSNPPYVCRSEAAAMARNVVGHEPHVALFVPDDDPLLFYRAIARAGHALLRPGGFLYAEINERFGRETARLLRRLGYEDVELRDDQFGKNRMIKGRYGKAEEADD